MASNGLGIEGLVLREGEPKQRLGHLEEEEARGLVTEARGLVTAFTCVASEREAIASVLAREARGLVNSEQMTCVGSDLENQRGQKTTLGCGGFLEYPMGLGFIEY